MDWHKFLEQTVIPGQRLWWSPDFSSSTAIRVGVRFWMMDCHEIWCTFMSQSGWIGRNLVIPELSILISLCPIFWSMTKIDLCLRDLILIIDFLYAFSSWMYKGIMWRAWSRNLTVWPLCSISKGCFLLLQILKHRFSENLCYIQAKLVL